MLLGRSWTEPFGEAMTFSMLPGSKLETSLNCDQTGEDRLSKSRKRTESENHRTEARHQAYGLTGHIHPPFFFSEMRKKEERARSYSSNKHPG